jgi:8-oxo-dGTP diphosphatase
LTKTPDWAAGSYPPFAVAVDLVVLTVRSGIFCGLAIERGAEPFQGIPALPGGFVHIDEGLDSAASRELEEETGVPSGRLHLEQLATYGAPNRDPRMRVVSVAYLALAPDLPSPAAGTDAASAEWQPVAELLSSRLAFDHDRILADGVERARGKLEYTTLATAFCEPQFTIGELRKVYEAVWGDELDPRNFHRKVMASAGFVVPLDRTTTRGGGRPARWYRAGSAEDLFPPLVRPHHVTAGRGSSRRRSK